MLTVRQVPAAGPERVAGGRGGRRGPSGLHGGLAGETGVRRRAHRQQSQRHVQDRDGLQLQERTHHSQRGVGRKGEGQCGRCMLPLLHVCGVQLLGLLCTTSPPPLPRPHPAPVPSFFPVWSNCGRVS